MSDLAFENGDAFLVDCQGCLRKGRLAQCGLPFAARRGQRCSAWPARPMISAAAPREPGSTPLVVALTEGSSVTCGENQFSEYLVNEPPAIARVTLEQTDNSEA